MKLEERFSLKLRAHKHPSQIDLLPSLMLELLRFQKISLKSIKPKVKNNDKSSGKSERHQIPFSTDSRGINKHSHSLRTLRSPRQNFPST
ncbi:hypothetical protein C5B90_19595 [Haloferax sp. Atlit-12N]|nr:hypothetical protein C5B90_19595 [Haloferax sp. Atlit-12N]